MKKTLLLAILAFSVNAFAQQTHQSLTSMENGRTGIVHQNMKTPDILSGLNPGLFLEHPTPGQRDLIQIVDSLYFWKWDTLSMVWKNVSKYIDMEYDAKNNLTSCVGQNWKNNIWKNSLKQTNTYDASNNLTNLIFLKWNGSDWENDWQNAYTYDAGKNQTSFIYSEWDGSAWVNSDQYIYTWDVNNNQTGYTYSFWNVSTWENSLQYTYTYDASNNQISQLKQNWNNSAWVNNLKYTSTFDISNNKIHELEQSWEGSAWKNYSQEINTYDASNNQKSSILQYWNNNSTWVNFSQFTYTYDAHDNRIHGLQKTWNGSVWGNSWQDFYTYDSNDNETGLLGQIFNGNEWLNRFQHTNTYDANNIIENYTNRSWNNTGTRVTNGDSTYFYFHTVIGIDDPTIPERGISVYPNPCSGKFTLSSNSMISSIEISNLFGERICSDFKLNRQTSIDLSGLKKGIYILKINSGTKSYDRKIVIR